jgi:hypothetical protein
MMSPTLNFVIVLTVSKKSCLSLVSIYYTLIYGLELHRFWSYSTGNMTWVQELFCPKSRFWYFCYANDFCYANGYTSTCSPRYRIFASTRNDVSPYMSKAFLSPIYFIILELRFYGIPFLFEIQILLCYSLHICVYLCHSLLP